MKEILTAARDTLSLLWMFAAWIAAITMVVILFTPPAEADENLLDPERWRPSAGAEGKSRLLDPTNDPWDSVLQVRVLEEDEWGCQIQAGWSQQYFKNIERRVCPQNFNDFYGRMSAAQKQKALEKGLAIIEGFVLGHPDREHIALVQFFLAETGATPS